MRLILLAALLLVAALGCSALPDLSDEPAEALQERENLEASELDDISSPELKQSDGESAYDSGRRISDGDSWRRRSGRSRRFRRFRGYFRALRSFLRLLRRDRTAGDEREDRRDDKRDDTRNARRRSRRGRGRGLRRLFRRLRSLARLVDGVNKETATCGGLSAQLRKRLDVWTVRLRPFLRVNATVEAAAALSGTVGTTPLPPSRGASASADSEEFEYY